MGTGIPPLAESMMCAYVWLDHVVSKREEDTCKLNVAENQKMALEIEMAQPKKKGGKGKGKKK
jgi:hypothetical protein